MGINFIRYAVRSDVGRVRKNNEDNLLYCNKCVMDNKTSEPYSAVGECSQPSIFAVFDGIGGESFGEKASLIAARKLSLFSDQICTANSCDFNQIIDSYVMETNNDINEQAKLLGSTMGTTAAIVIVSQNYIYAYNVGDTRIYVYECGRLRQISIDHTLARKKMESGQYTYAEARKSTDWGKLTACLGIQKSNGEFDKIAHLSVIQARKRQRLLICSDGLSDMLPEDVLAHHLGLFNAPQNVAKRLMSDALNRGGKDNTSLIVLDICNWRFSI